MRAVIQRVSAASVDIDEIQVAGIEKGLLVLVAMDPLDTLEDAAWLAGKIFRMRIFSDSEGAMNLDVSQVQGDILVVSQFTLFASTKKGNRPSFSASAKPDLAIPLYQSFLNELEKLLGHPPPQGKFGADMKVKLMNDGPVTIFIDSKKPE